VQRVRTISLVVLILLGVGGLFGGLAFLSAPSGRRLGMTVDQLPSWPLLGNYLLPGIALVLLFGVLPLIAARRVARRSPAGWSLTTTIGLLLIGWMALQILAIGLSFPAMQVALLVVGIALTGLGIDGGTLQAADDSRRAERSYRHADDELRPRPPVSRGEPYRGRGPRRPADRSHTLH